MDFVAGLAALSLKNPPEEELATYLGQTGFLQVLNKYVARVVDERPEDPGHSLATWLAQDYGIAPVSMTADLAAAAAAESVVLPTEEATKVLADGTKIEADTDAAEQLSPAQLTALLQQGLRPALHLSCGLGAADLNTLNVSIAVNHAALNGWVKQPAPCCAASSLAGAWNAAHGLSRPQPYPEASRIFPTAADPSEEERVSVWQGVWQPRAYGNEVVPALFHKDTLQAMGDVLRAKIKSSAVTIMHALGCLRVDRPASPQTELERQIHASISAADLDTFGAMAPLVAHTVELFPQYFQTHVRFPDGSRSKAKKVTKPMFFAAIRAAVESVLIARVQEGIIVLPTNKGDAEDPPAAPEANEGVNSSETADLRSLKMPEWDCFTAYAEALEVDAADAVVAATAGDASDPSIPDTDDDSTNPATQLGVASAIADDIEDGDDNDADHNDGDGDDDDDDDGDEANLGGGAALKSKKKKRASKKGNTGKTSVPRWRQLTGEVMHKFRGLCRASPDQERPSTAIYGNWGILQGAKYLDRYFGGGAIVAEEIAGRAAANSSKATKKAKFTVPYINTGKEASPPSEKQLAYQWGQLWAQFNTPYTTLIYHLKNHYALIFALRQYTEIEEGVTVHHREILTTRRGQRPKTWIPWSEVHATLRSWTGHKIMAVHAPRQFATTLHSVGQFAGDTTKKGK